MSASSVADRIAQLRLAGKESFKKRLVDAGAQEVEAEACWALFSSVEQVSEVTRSLGQEREGKICMHAASTEACMHAPNMHVPQALPYITSGDDGRRGYKNPWQECEWPEASKQSTFLI